jgi:hypothetical protein
MADSNVVPISYAYTNDGLRNLVSGLGTAKAKSNHYHFVFTPLNQMHNRL